MSQSKEFLNDILNDQYDRRAYTLENVGGNLYELDEDMTRYDQVGTGLTAEDIVDVGVLACDHVKTGTAHNLVNPNTLAGTVRFVATADYVSGDTFAYNGSALLIRGTPYFKSGDFVIGLISDGGISFVAGSGLESDASALILAAYPVGSIYLSTASTNPGTLFGGTWARFGNGRVLVGIDEGDTDFNAAQKTGGAKTVTLTTAQIPEHLHGLAARDGDTGPLSGYVPDAGTVLVSNKTGYDMSYGGAGGAHTNVQPYITCYMWRRTA